MKIFAVINERTGHRIELNWMHCMWSKE